MQAITSRLTLLVNLAMVPVPRDRPLGKRHRPKTLLLLHRAPLILVVMRAGTPVVRPAVMLPLLLASTSVGGDHMVPTVVVDLAALINLPAGVVVQPRHHLRGPAALPVGITPLLSAPVRCAGAALVGLPEVVPAVLARTTVGGPVPQGTAVPGRRGRQVPAGLDPTGAAYSHRAPPRCSRGRSGLRLAAINQLALPHPRRLALASGLRRGANPGVGIRLRGVPVRGSVCLVQRWAEVPVASFV
mmetsp:Transcript_10311/g.26204  ORF Transcript_10311/g.26204 Transcript_10311/m.26204 type:complete len:244 (+) Transcript_10311:2404-3135(+)